MKLTQDIDLNQTGTRDIIQTCREGRQTFICDCVAVGQGQSVWVCVTLCLWSDIGAKLRGGEAEGFDSLRIFRVRGILPMMPSGPTRPDIARTARLLSRPLRVRYALNVVVSDLTRMQGGESC